jgi:amino acid permease
MLPILDSSLASHYICVVPEISDEILINRVLLRSAIPLKARSPTLCRPLCQSRCLVIFPFCIFCPLPVLFHTFNLNLLQVLRITYSLGLLFSVPIQFFPALEILESSLETHLMRQLTSRARVSLRLLVCVCCTFVAILCRNYFGYFTSIIGSIGCSALLFIFPSIFHLNTFKYTLTPALRRRNYALIALGIVLGGASFSLSVMSIANGDSG